MWSPKPRPRSCSRCASWFDRSSSSWYVTTVPEPAMTCAGLSGLAAACGPGHIAGHPSDPGPGQESPRTFLSFSATVAASSSANVCSRSASAASSTPRMRAASKPALRALPTATVATGMPAGICTIESSESSPYEVLERHRDADHRQRRHRRRHAGQVCRAARTGDDHADAAVGGGARVLVHHVGGAVRGHDAHLVRRRRTRRARRPRPASRRRSESLPMMTPTSGAVAPSTHVTLGVSCGRD